MDPSPVLFEFKPKRELLDSNFDGYKLTLDEVTKVHKNLQTPVYVVALKHDQTSYMHAKLFGLHNHLVGDPFDVDTSVYFVDNDWNICKMYYDQHSKVIHGPVKVFAIPKQDDVTDNYNVTFKFVSRFLAVLSDGMGTLWVLDTKNRSTDSEFIILHHARTLGTKKGFIISDAIYNDVSNEIKILLLKVEKKLGSERAVNNVRWVTVSKKDNNWTQTAWKELEAPGDIQYLNFERNGEAIYIISENEFKFVLNSEYQIKFNENDVAERENTLNKTHSWSQTSQNINLDVYLPLNFDITNVEVQTRINDIEIKCGNNIFLSGNLYKSIDSSLTTWEIKHDVLEICLYKQEVDIMWPEVIIGNKTGDYIDSTTEVSQTLQNLTSDSVANPPTGVTFNSQEVEECDFENNADSLIFQRLCERTNEITHKSYLGTHQVILTVDFDIGTTSAIGLRHDVDVCLWQPTKSEETFEVVHEGTLLAFGYVQASKSNKKFCVCSPDLKYSCISECSRHLFIYRQSRAVEENELRNRVTGRRIVVAQQQVVSIPDEEVVGIYATDLFLYLLGKNYMAVIEM